MGGAMSFRILAFVLRVTHVLKMRSVGFLSLLFLCWKLRSPLLIAQSCSSLRMQQEYQLHEALSASLGSQLLPLWTSLCWVQMSSVIILSCSFGGLSLLQGCGLLEG